MSTSSLYRVIKKGHEETLERKLTDDETECLISRISRDNYKRRTDCKEKGITCIRPEPTKEYLESLLKEDC